MKDAKGHGSNPRGTHTAGVEAIGQRPMQPGMWYHGSPTGQPGGMGPVHVGTAVAAKQALEARIGIPADGKGWDGSREYGKTLLAGRDTLMRMDPRGYNLTGYQAAGPKEDHYPSGNATFSNGEKVPLNATPAVHAYNIVGPMSNTPNNAYEDFKANGMAKRLKNRGVYYSNVGEDEGSVSAIVPSPAHLRRAG